MSFLSMAENLDSDVICRRMLLWLIRINSAVIVCGLTNALDVRKVCAKDVSERCVRNNNCGDNSAVHTRRLQAKDLVCALTVSLGNYDI